MLSKKQIPQQYYQKDAHPQHVHTQQNMLIHNMFIDTLLVVAISVQVSVQVSHVSVFSLRATMDLQVKRYRLPDSDVPVVSLQNALKVWFNKCGDRTINRLLKIVARDWPTRGSPLPSELSQFVPFAFAESMAEVDETLHPRHARLVSAITAENLSKQCIDSDRRPELEAMLLSRTMLSMFSKYRDLVKYADKYAGCMRRATGEQKTKLDGLLDKIHLPDSHARGMGGSVVALPPIGKRLVATPPVADATFDDLDALAIELGQLATTKM